jgi:hypothetical protein
VPSDVSARGAHFAISVNKQDINLLKVCLDSQDSVANRFDCFIQGLIASTRDSDPRPFFLKTLRRRQADTAVPASHYCHFPFQSLHLSS